MTDMRLYPNLFLHIYKKHKVLPQNTKSSDFKATTQRWRTLRSDLWSLDHDISKDGPVTVVIDRLEINTVIVMNILIVVFDTIVVK